MYCPHKLGQSILALIPLISLLIASAGDADGGYMYVFAFLYDGVHRPIDQGYYEIVWGSGEPQTVEAEKFIKMQIEAEADVVE